MVKFLGEHAESFAGEVPNNSTQLAILAIKVHEVFLNDDDDTTGKLPSVLEVIAAVKAVMEANEKPAAELNQIVRDTRA